MVHKVVNNLLNNISMGKGGGIMWPGIVTGR